MRSFIAPELFPVAAGELNLNYAINVPIANHAGRQVQLVGHASQRHGMACGHLINDAFRPQDVGGEDAYNTLDESNCTACWSNGSVLMRSTRFVPKGRELLFRYGADHWIDRAEFTTQEATGEATGSKSRRPTPDTASSSPRPRPAPARAWPGWTRSVRPQGPCREQTRAAW